MSRKALTLSGGSVKGAFQAGAIKAVIKKGYYPDHLYGISVGSLNSTFINNEAGKQRLPSEQLDWNRISDNLVSFWSDRITKPSDLVLKHGILKLLFNTLTRRFTGLVNTLPLKKMVYREIDPENLRKSPLRQSVGTVNIMNGDIVYADPSRPDFLEYVIASTAMPLIMPAMKIRSQQDQPFFDGGLRDVAPLKRAIRDHADSVICILCQPENLALKPINPENLFQLSERVIDIMVDEIERNDIDLAIKINRFLPPDGNPAKDGPYAGKRKINICVIRPETPITSDVTNFTSEEIRKMIGLGYDTAINQLNGFI